MALFLDAYCKRKQLIFLNVYGWAVVLALRALELDPGRPQRQALQPELLVGQRQHRPKWLGSVAAHQSNIKQPQQGLNQTKICCNVPYQGIFSYHPSSLVP